MNKNLLSVCLGLVLAGGTVQTASADDLLQIYDLAKRNDPTYGAAFAQYNADIEKSPQAWSGVLPQVNLSGTHIQFDEDRTISGVTTAQSYDSDTYGLSLRQTLFDNAKFNAISQADALVAKAEADFNNAADDLILRVAQNYFTVLSETENLAFAQAEKKAIAQQLNQAKQRFNVGLTAITDVHEAQARYDQAVASEIEAQRLLDISRETLRELTGQEHQQLARVNEAHVMVSPDPQDIDAWVKTALDNNLLLLSAKKSMEAASEGVDLARSGHYPTLDLTADYFDNETSGGQFGPTQRDGTSVSLELNLPLYLGGAVNSSTREAAALYMQSKELHEKQRRATERQARNSYFTVISALSQVAALKQALVSTQTALEATQAGFEVGTRTAVDVLDSQREVYRAKRDYIRARHGYILSSLSLKQAAGTLADEDVRLINNWLK